MAVRNVPKTDHIVRLVKPTLLMRDEDTNEVTGCFPAAFRLREESATREAEKHLSVSWLEYFPGGRLDQIKKIRDHAELELRPNHAFANLSVEEVHQACETAGVKIRVLHDPTSGNPSHSAVHRWPRTHDELFALVANLASLNLTLAKDIPKT